MMLGVIYMYTCKQTGKSYIGQTWNLTKRKSRHKKAEGRHALFYGAIKEYGHESFSLTILRDGIESQAMLDEAEREEIKKHNTLAPNGYNQAVGGLSGSFGEGFKKKCSESARERWLSPGQREQAKEKTDRYFAIPANREKASRINREAWNNNPDHRRKVLAEIARRKDDPAWKAKNLEAMRRRCRPIVCVDTGVVFSGLTDAHDKTGISVSNICNALNGRSLRAGGFRWEYARQEGVNAEAVR